MYSISEAAHLLGVSIGTLRNWHRDGKLIPVLLASGHRRYTPELLAQAKGLKTTKMNVIYCRESTKTQKHSLEAQAETSSRFYQGTR
jgi:predicted site-specific integrase-resolvase